MIGDVLDGKYRIVAPLGTGGMGTVYRATHLGTDRTVAVKVINRRYVGNPALLERFRREAHAAGRLRSPNIVDVTDFGVVDGASGETAYLVMEYLEGCSLEDLLGQIQVPALTWTVDVFEQVCLAIEEAHAHGVLHRDLKPANIWLEPDRRGGTTAKVLDFGIARLDALIHEPDPSDEAGGIGLAGSGPATLAAGSPKVAGVSHSATLVPAPPDVTQALGADPLDRGDDVTLTSVGAVIGTPAFMAPEQACGVRADARADVYALAATLYTMLAGRRPFASVPAVELMERRRTALPEPPRSVNPAVSKRISDLVMQALAIDPNGRPRSPEVLAAMLRGRADGVGMLVRRAIVFGTTHLPAFLPTLLLVYLPVFFVQALLRAERIELSFGREGNHVLASNAAAFGVLLAESVAVVVVRGFSAVVMAQVLAAPMRTPSTGPALDLLRARKGRAAVAIATFLLADALPFNLATHLLAFAASWPLAGPATLAGAGTILIVLVIVAGLFALFARLCLYPVVFVVDGLTGVAGLHRAWAVTSALPSLAFRLAAVDLGLWSAEVLVEKVVFPAMLGETQVLVAQRVAFFLAFQAIVAPTLSIAYAMLYVNLRLARGETARAILSPLAMSVDLAADFASVVDDARSRSLGGTFRKKKTDQATRNQ